jgi:uncharacterized protein (TIGR03000 family)
VPSNHRAPNVVLPQPSNSEAKAKRLPATVVIRASSDVKIMVNGEETRRNKDVETFTTPELVPGKTYAYQISAEVTRDGRVYATSKRLLVRAGQQSTIDFGDMSAVIAEEQKQTARIKVILPKGGKLFVDGNEQPTMAETQTFDTPKLAKGKNYFYVLKVEVSDGQDVVGARQEKVTVTAGKEVTVDFRSKFLAQR